VKIGNLNGFSSLKKCVVKKQAHRHTHSRDHEACRVEKCPFFSEESGAGLKSDAK
jgi:hypothetical protein